MQSYYLIIFHFRNFCNQMTSDAKHTHACVELAPKTWFATVRALVCGACDISNSTHELALHQTYGHTFLFGVRFLLPCPLILNSNINFNFMCRFSHSHKFIRFCFSFFIPLFLFLLAEIVLYASSLYLLFPLSQFFDLQIKKKSQMLFAVAWRGIA